LIERGETQDTRHLVPLARALKINPQWLYTGTGPKYSDDWDQVVNISGLPDDAQAGIFELVAALEDGRLTPARFLSLLNLALGRDP
jgi:hypothetical protein